MKYTHHIQEKPYWCVPACLESILESRGFLITQQYIAEKLGTTKEKGTKIDKETLNQFLRNYNLRSTFFNPFLTYNDELEMVLTREIGNSSDILVLYNSTIVHQLSNNSHLGHTSIIIEYDIKTDKVTLLDPFKEQQVTIPLYGPGKSLMNSIQAKENMNYGLYIISQLFKTPCQFNNNCSCPQPIG